MLSKFFSLFLIAFVVLHITPSAFACSPRAICGDGHSYSDPAHKFDREERAQMQRFCENMAERVCNQIKQQAEKNAKLEIRRHQRQEH